MASSITEVDTIKFFLGWFLKSCIDSTTTLSIGNANDFFRGIWTALRALHSTTKFGKGDG